LRSEFPDQMRSVNRDASCARANARNQRTPKPARTP
jgi:hypothetical protein